MNHEATFDTNLDDTWFVTCSCGWEAFGLDSLEDAEGVHTDHMDEALSS